MPGPEENEPAVMTDDDAQSQAVEPTAVVGSGAPTPPPPTPPSAPAAPAPPAPLPVRPVRRFPATGEMVGPFTLGEVLGHGGFAHVYRATGPDGAEVALKVLTGLQDGSVERFEQEARLLEQVSGRGFPEFVESGLDDEQPWFAMELLHGSTLRDHVRSAGPMDPSQALRLADQLASALLVLQEQRCVHRDLKPANIMVEGDRVVLIDLGIAKLFDAATSTQPVGTLAYMAPELFARHVHPRSDVYSLGLLLVFACTGNLPPDLNFLGRDLEAEDLVEELPRDARGAGTAIGAGTEPPVIDKHLRSLILSMTRYQPNHRPALENVARVLRARLAGEDADDTVLLTERVVSDGATEAERALGPVAELATTVGLPGRIERATKVMVRPGTEAREATARAREPWHALVYDAALMSVLSEVHGDGFDGAAEQVIAEHVGSIGPQIAEGATPAEIKDWVWAAMRWTGATPPDGHVDTLRGWRAYRNPEQPPPPSPVAARNEVAPTKVALVEVAQTEAARTDVARTDIARTTAMPAAHLDPQAFRQTQVMPAAEAAATRVARPAPPSVQPRKSPVRHLGPTPQPGSVHPRSLQPRNLQPRNAAAGGGTRPQPSGPAVAPPQAAPRPPSGAVAPPAASPARPRPGAARAGGALLRFVPRLLLLAAVARTVMLAPVGPYQRTEPILGLPLQLLEALGVSPALAGRVEGPVLALGALVVAALLRAAGHRMWLWIYVLVVFGTIAAGLVLG